MTARQLSAGKLRFYSQTNGKKVPLGENLIQAIALHDRLVGGQTTPHDAAFGDLAALTEEEISAVSTPMNRVCGVYFLLLAKRIVYIGKSKNIWRRILEHERSGRSFDAFCWQACQPEKLDVLETHCIRKYRPPFNAAKPSFSTVLKKPN